MSESGASPPVRDCVDVAVGVLIDADGRFLLTSRPPGKVYEGYWEFPGGKVEPGETVDQALRRELIEELGVTIGATEAWQVQEFDYPHARVRLHFLRVRQWQGTFEMREGQQMAWQTLPVAVTPVLPGTVPVLRWMAQEQGFEGDTHAPDLTASWLDQVSWDAQGLVPVIAQEKGSGDVLMVAWMNREALALTVQRQVAVYWSRSRQRLWRKGEESGHVQQVHDIRLDCDADVILLTVTQLGHDPGIACHTGRHSCFFLQLQLDGGASAPNWLTAEPVLKDPETIYR